MDLIQHMKHERDGKIRGVYWLFQVNMAFNSNKIEGSRLSKAQTQYLFDEKKIYSENGNGVSLNDIQEAINHFKAFDYILDSFDDELSIDIIKKLHYLIKQNTSDEGNPLTPIGEFKITENIIGLFDSVSTTAPEKVEYELTKLLDWYLKKDNVKLEEIVDFHWKFEKIHPFADGNGRVGRLIIFKECLKNNIMPSIILDKYRDFYLLGLKEYDRDSKKRLIETFKAGQDFSEEILKQLNFQGQINSALFIKNKADEELYMAPDEEKIIWEGLEKDERINSEEAKRILIGENDE